MNKKLDKNQKKKLVIVCVLLFLFTCGIPLGYFTIFQKIDRAFCLHSVSREIGIQPNYQSLFMYINNNLKIGMTREETENVLKKIGILDIKYDEPIQQNTTFEFVRIKMCNHPFNNIQISLQFDNSQKLSSFIIYNGE
jgi:hypothetical protein